MDAQSTQLTQELGRLGRRRTKLVTQTEAVEGELRRLVVSADGEIPRNLIANLAGVSRQTIYNWLGRE